MTREDQLQEIVVRLRRDLPPGTAEERNREIRQRIDALPADERAVVDDLLGPVPPAAGTSDPDPAGVMAKTLFPQLGDRSLVPFEFEDFDAFQKRYETWLDFGGWWPSGEPRLDWVGGNSPLHERARAM